MHHPKTRRWTLQVMPDNGGTVRLVHVSRRLVRLGVLAGLLFVVSGVGFAVDLVLGSKREAELAMVHSENRHLTDHLSRMERQVATLAGSIDRLSAGDQRVRLLAGLAPIAPEIQDVGIGGPAIADPAREEFFRISSAVAERTYAVKYGVEELTRKADLLSKSLDEALDSLRMHEEVFLARPSVRPVQSDESWISSSFSRSRYHPILQYNRPHEGLDFSAFAGSPILATADGTVTYAGTKGSYGKTIEIQHGFGYQTRYAHAGRIKVRVGQKVRRGDELGEVGRTGLASGPNLHYEVLINGRPVNPRRFLLDQKIFE